MTVSLFNKFFAGTDALYHSYTETVFLQHILIVRLIAPCPHHGIPVPGMQLSEEKGGNFYEKGHKILPFCPDPVLYFQGRLGAGNYRASS
jgi:hypothetical protein